MSSLKIFSRVRSSPSSEIDPRRAVLFYGIVTAVLLLVEILPSERFLENHLARPIEFKFRHWLKRDPKLDPLIRIYAFDDTALKLVQDEDLSLEEWASVLKTLAPSHPRAVFVDKVFGTPRGVEKAEAFVSALKALPFPVVGGAFLTGQAIRDWPTFPVRREFDLRDALTSQATSPNPSSPDWSSIEWLAPETKFVYGPDPRVLDGFSRIGHLVWNGLEVPSMIRVERERALPAAPLLLAEHLYFREGKLYADERPVEAESNGKVLINLSHPENYYDHTQSLARLIRLARAGSAERLPDGAVVVLLPLFYTGHTDVLPTPFGMMPGGYLEVALANSVLTGDWISPPRGTIPALLISAVAGCLLGLRLAGPSFTLGFLGVSAATFLAGSLSFAFYRQELPWLIALLGFALSSLAVFLEKARLAGIKVRRLKDALIGAVSQERLTEILSGISPVQLEPTNRIVTIMFIDVVDFSLIAERQTPEEAFRNIKALITDLRAIVHQAGGVVDKTLGDGMLCFFGYYYDGKGEVDGHADRAVECAIKIHRFNYDRNRARWRRGLPFIHSVLASIPHRPTSATSGRSDEST